MALLRSFGIGIGVGGVAGLLSILVLRRLRKSQHAYPLILGSLLVLYVLIDYLKGSAALGILTVAVMVGNAPALSKAVGLEKTAKLGSGVKNVHDQIAFFVKSFFFVFIGAMLSPPWGLIALGIVLGLLLLVARVPAVHIATLGSGMSKAAKGVITVSMPRGMAAGVLAIMPAAAMRMTEGGEVPALPGTDDLPVVVFAAVVTTILVFAVGFPVLRRKLGPEDRAAEGTVTQKKKTVAADDTDSLTTETPSWREESGSIPVTLENSLESLGLSPDQKAALTVPETEPPPGMDAPDESEATPPDAGSD